MLSTKEVNGRKSITITRQDLSVINTSSRFNLVRKDQPNPIFKVWQTFFYQGPLSYLPLLIFLAFILVLILRRIFINYDTTRISIGVIGLIATCTMELFYFIRYNVGIPWFCTPDTIGWLWTIINFLLYGFILSNQIRLCFEVIAELSKDNAFNLQIGIFSIPIAVIIYHLLYS